MGGSSSKGPSVHEQMANEKVKVLITNGKSTLKDYSAARKVIIAKFPDLKVFQNKTSDAKEFIITLDGENIHTTANVTEEQQAEILKKIEEKVTAAAEAAPAAAEVTEAVILPKVEEAAEELQVSLVQVSSLKNLKVGAMHPDDNVLPAPPQGFGGDPLKQQVQTRHPLVRRPQP